jgi:hypothetical protein
MEEGLLYADDLPKRDPAGFAILEEYTRSHRADVARDAVPTLHLRSRREFNKRVLFRAAYKARGLVVGFNLPFDLARIASGWGKAEGSFSGGFSLVLWERQDKNGVWQPNPYRPRVCIKQLDSKRALIGFTRRSEPDRYDLIPEGSIDGQPDGKYAFSGYFLDLHTLAFALTNENYSLERACAAFGVAHGKGSVERHGVITPEYIAYNRRDVLATADLLEQLRAEYDRHPIGLHPTKAFSPASIAKAYLRAMGIVPALAHTERNGSK